MTSERQTTGQTEKKIYSAPRLTVHGSIASVTKGNSSVPGVDLASRRPQARPGDEKGKIKGPAKAGPGDKSPW